MPKTADKSPAAAKTVPKENKKVVHPAAKKPKPAANSPKSASAASNSKSKSAPKKGVAPKKSGQKAGSLVHDVQNLVVPFGLLLAKNGVEYLVKRSKKKSLSKGKRGGDPLAAIRQEGSCACGATTQIAGASTAFQTELTNLAQDLRRIVHSYS